MYQYYKTQFQSLKTFQRNGKTAPHKAILLLSVLELIEQGLLKNNKIRLSDTLEQTFHSMWIRYVDPSPLFHEKLATPFWHLSHESFWKLLSFSGQEITKENFQGSSYSLNNLRKQVEYAQMDTELFNILQNQANRISLRKELIVKYLYIEI